MPSANPLTSAQQKFLRGLAMKLKPRVAIGKNGLTDNCLKELRAALEREELIKVKVPGKAAERKLLAKQTAEKTESNLVGMVGTMAAFYRPSPALVKRQITLPN